MVAASFAGLATRAALKWWPDTQGLVDDVVVLGAPNHGTLDATALGLLGCPPSFWQARPGSAFLGAVNATTETPGPVSYTSVYSRTADAVTPEFPGTGTLGLAGASNVAIQDVCPLGVVVDPFARLWDPAAFALVVDALTHPGPADPSRVDRWVCGQPDKPGVNPVDGLAPGCAWYRHVVVADLTARVATEPPLQPWAVPVARRPVHLPGPALRARPGEGFCPMRAKSFPRSPAGRGPPPPRSPKL